MQIDLCTGGDLGLFCSDLFQPKDVKTLVSLDRNFLAHAIRKGYNVAYGDLNKLEINRAPRCLMVHPYPVILTASTLAEYQKVYNLHPGYLPWGRGMYPIAWAIFDGSKAGATIYEVTPKLDAGPIVMQEEVPVAIDDTAGTLTCKVRKVERSMLAKFSTMVLSDKEIPTWLLATSDYTYHAKAEFEQLRTSGVLGTPWYAYMVTLLRMFTCDPYPGLEIKIGNSTFEVVLKKIK